MVKIVATADNHLNIHYRKMSPSKLEKRREYIRAAFKQTIDFSLANKIDLYLHAGDLFDNPAPKNYDISFVVDNLLQLKENNVGVYMISGTHDVYKISYDTSTQQIFKVAKLAYLFPQDKIVKKKISINNINLSIAGVSYNPTLSQDPLELYNLSKEDDEDIVILLLHIGIEGHIYPTLTEPMVFMKNILSSGVDIVIAGHQHKYACFEKDRKIILIPGATERMNFGEVNNIPGFFYIELEKNNNKINKKIKRIQIKPQPMEEVSINLSELEPQEDVSSYIIGIIMEKSGKDKLLKCKIKGVIDIKKFHQIRYREIFLAGSEANFYFDLDTKELLVSDASCNKYLSSQETPKMGAVISIKQEIHQETLRLLKQAKSDEERELLIQAERLATSLIST